MDGELHVFIVLNSHSISHHYSSDSSNMASPSSICVPCLRTMRTLIVRPQTTPPRLLANSIRSYHIPTATPQRPLFLDFLAPSTSRVNRNPQTSYPTTQASHRTFATASATATVEPTQQPPHQYLARAVQNPRKNEEGTEMLISISPRASSRLTKISNDDQNPNLALRVTVESGGCHGFQYLMSLTDLSSSPATEEDTLFEDDKGAKVVIDEASLELLYGSTVDYTMELIGSQFKVTGIPGATSSCGCGTSFDIKL
ncbi:hypothetical protein B0J11DRAFT_515746 [Dendryphion nanum]|uniref:Core domain-containing protein n=1 Tax=Dendryphion nanum TaxID=256645 RepID=A0A9P9EL05_9PLEO|nr:hypothetical protein B0J11DRAFT_515746 [Dendryphion nanum]